MELLLAAAIATCATNPEVCTYNDLGQMTVVEVCDIAPEAQAEPLTFIAELPDGIYQITLAPKCLDY